MTAVMLPTTTSAAKASTGPAESASAAGLVGMRERSRLSCSTRARTGLRNRNRTVHAVGPSKATTAEKSLMEPRSLEFGLAASNRAFRGISSWVAWTALVDTAARVAPESLAAARTRALAGHTGTAEQKETRQIVQSNLSNQARAGHSLEAASKAVLREVRPDTPLTSFRSRASI